MSILFPLIMVPTYYASNADPLIFYATTAGVLSGAVAGDHMSPISDTTVLSALACDCDLVSHVLTQAPYAMTISVLSVVVGTLPIGHEAWPNMIGILIGWVLTGLFIAFLGKPAVNANGSYDFLTELYMKCKKGYSPLEDLRHDTIEKYESYQGEDPNALNCNVFGRWWKKKPEEVEEKGIEEEDSSMDKKDEMEKAVDEPDDDSQYSEPADEDAPMVLKEPDPNKASYKARASSEFMA
jgi:hypothetical protein